MKFYTLFLAESCNSILKAIKILPFSSKKKKKIKNLDREVFFSHHISYLFLCSLNDKFNFKPAIRPTNSLNQTTKLSLFLFPLPFLSYLFILFFKLTLSETKCPFYMLTLITLLISYNIVLP